MTETPPRQVRIPRETWEVAMQRARSEGRTLSAIMRRAVEDYAAGAYLPGDDEPDLYAQRWEMEHR